MRQQCIEALEEFADGAVMDEIGEFVQRRGVAIRDGEKRAGAFGDDGRDPANWTYGDEPKMMKTSAFERG
jgi:hypothetical protein